jgi:hypothetical protein
MTQAQIDLCLYLILALAVFLLIREVICWYFKINKRVELQEKMLAEMVKINNKPIYDLEFNEAFEDGHPKGSNKGD